MTQSVMTARSPRLVVGVDESDESMAALRWAIDQARATGANVEVVYAFERPMPVPYSPAIRVPAEDFVHEAEVSLLALIARELGDRPDLDVTVSVEEGKPADILAEAARGAALLVLGSSGGHGILEMLAGSTDYAVIHRTPCPLVLVPVQDPASTP